MGKDMDKKERKNMSDQGGIARVPDLGKQRPMPSLRLRAQAL